MAIRRSLGNQAGRSRSYRWSVTPRSLISPLDTTGGVNTEVNSALLAKSLLSDHRLRAEGHCQAPRLQWVQRHELKCHRPGRAELQHARGREALAADLEVVLLPFGRVKREKRKAKGGTESSKDKTTRGACVVVGGKGGSERAIATSRQCHNRPDP